MKSFTNRLGVAIMLMLFMGIVMAYDLAKCSIAANYISPLECFTVVFTPIGTMGGIVLAASVNKSKAENTGADGEGIKYMIAKEDK